MTITFTNHIPTKSWTHSGFSALALKVNTRAGLGAKLATLAAAAARAVYFRAKAVSSVQAAFCIRREIAVVPREY